MSRRSTTLPTQQPDALTLAAGTWLAAGMVLFGLTPLPFHDAAWGWSPAFWLLLAPAIMLCAQFARRHRWPPRATVIRRGVRRQGSAPSRPAAARRRRMTGALRVPAYGHDGRQRRALR